MGEGEGERELRYWTDRLCAAVAYPGILIEGGSTNSVEDRENGDLYAVAPSSGVLEAAVIWYKKIHFI